MRLLVFVVLVGYAVKCDDDASYYVIEVPKESQRHEQHKPFRVYWNVPTMQCKSKRIPFNDLQRFGIIQNTGDSFRGEEVTILYDPGLFPALLKYESNGKLEFRNGGVPQEGSLEKHWDAFRAIMDQSIPDPEFSGVGVIDFESWRPVFRQNFGVLIPYKDISYQIERKQHWLWPEKAIQARARQRFEESARAFMQTTLSIAKQMRPKALWGYYAYPYCFNKAGADSCASGVPKENDNINWLWHESTALYPSVYLSQSLSAREAGVLVRGRVREAARLQRRGAPILPYFWFRYRDGGFLPQEDLDVVLDTLYKSNASGFIIWGSSKDVDTLDKCQKLLEYTEEILGPSIAKYTKRKGTITSDNVRPTNSPPNSGITTWRPILKDHLLDETNNSESPIINPDYHWTPPENYTQDIVHYVEHHYKDNNNITNEENKPTLIQINKNSLVNILLNMLLSGNRDTSESESDNIDFKTKDDAATKLDTSENFTSSNNISVTLTNESGYFNNRKSFNSTENADSVKDTERDAKVPIKSEDLTTTVGYFSTTENNVVINATSYVHETAVNTINVNMAGIEHSNISHINFLSTTESTTANNNFETEGASETSEPSTLISSTDLLTLMRDIISDNATSTTTHESLENFTSSESTFFDVDTTVSGDFTTDSPDNTIDNSLTSESYNDSENIAATTHDTLVDNKPTTESISDIEFESTLLDNTSTHKPLAITQSFESFNGKTDTKSSKKGHHKEDNLSNDIELGLATDSIIIPLINSNEFISTKQEALSSPVTSSEYDNKKDKLSSESVTLSTLTGEPTESLNKLHLFNDDSADSYEDSDPINSDFNLIRSKDGKKGFHTGPNVFISPNANSDTTESEIFTSVDREDDDKNGQYGGDESTTFAETTTNSVLQVVVSL